MAMNYYFHIHGENFDLSEKGTNFFQEYILGKGLDAVDLLFSDPTTGHISPVTPLIGYSSPLRHGSNTFEVLRNSVR